MLRALCVAAIFVSIPMMGYPKQQKQRVWQQIASQRHAIFDSVDATLSVVEDLSATSACAIAVFLSRDDFT